MAQFKCTGLDELCDAFAKAKNVPNDVLAAMLKSMGKVLLKAIKATSVPGVADSSFLQKIKLGREKIIDTGGYIFITFSGKRIDSKHKSGKTREAEIAFLNEFGVPRKQGARPFMKYAIEEKEDAIASAGAKIFYDWLEQVGL